MSNEIQKLVNKIIEHKKKYYNEVPEISDSEYDALENKLKEICPNHPVLSMVGTNFVQDGFDEFDYVSAGYPKMLSLEKVHSSEEVKKFADNRLLIPMQKLDGLSCSCLYENGKLVKAWTRGNGKVGDDVTQNMNFVKCSIPLNLPKPGKFVIRGEVLMLKKDFEQLNIEQEKNGLEKFTGCRAAASGSFKQLDTSVTASRNLTFFAYEFKDLNYSIPNKSKYNELHMLQDWGFNVPIIETNTFDDSIKTVIENFEKERPNLPYDVDGLVFAVDDLMLYEELGCTGHHPRHSIAFKGKSEEGITTLIRKEWEVSRNGYLIPVGILKPIELADAVITRVTLHNAKFIVDNEINDGEDIVISRSGDIIPYFKKMVFDQEDIKFINLPTTCPSCSEPLEWDSVHLKCGDKNCVGQVTKNIIHYVSKPCVNIEGVGEKLVEELVRNGIVSNPSHLFKLTKQDLMKLDRMGEKKCQNVLDAINNAKKQTKVVFLKSLGIDQLGKTISADIEKYVDLKTCTVSIDLKTIDGISDTTEKAIINGLQENYELVQELLKYIEVIEPIQKKIESSNNVLNGKTFCITGKVVFNYKGQLIETREKIEEIITEKGGVNVSGISKKLDFLFAGENTGSKIEKAKKLNITIIGINEFVDLLNNV